jgi:hypothetical protein
MRRSYKDTNELQLEQVMNGFVGCSNYLLYLPYFVAGWRGGAAAG